MTWFELDKARLVLEYLRVKGAYPSFTLRRDGELLCWEGELRISVAETEAEAFHIKVTYPDAFPAVLPHLEAVSPEIDPSEVGHAWHRWSYSGDICFLRPINWNISFTADEIIAKAADWYFNYVAVKRGLAAAMPDVGRVAIGESR
jgi:hypothetical protein